jgi:formate-dependent nitrite reductase cytochrome c552 subunit
MDMDKLMEMLKTMMDNNQAKAEADRIAVRENLKEIMEKMDANQAKADAHQAKMDANMRSMKAELKSVIQGFKINGEETMTGREKTEARLEGEEEPTSVEIKREVADEESQWRTPK